MLKKAFYTALILLGAVCIAASVVALVVSSGISIGTFLPAIAGVVFIAYALAHILRPGPIIKIRWLRVALTVLVCAAIAVFAAVEALIIGCAASSRPSDDANFVIVPGAGIFPDGRLTLTLKDRLDTAYDYLSEHGDAICIVSGGQGANEPRTEASAMKEYLMAKGIAASRIIEEAKATDTKENMKFSAQIIEERYPETEKTAVVVTSGFHMYRSLALARYCGITASGQSAPSPWFLAINNYMREFVGFFKMLILDMR